MNQIMKSSKVKTIVKLMTLYVLSIFLTIIILFDPSLLSNASLITVVYSQGIISCMRYSVLPCFFVSLVVCAVLYFGTLSWKGNRKIKVAVGVLFAILQTVSINFYYFYSVIYAINQPDIIFYDILYFAACGILFFFIENVCFLLLDKVSSLSVNRLLGKASILIEKHIGSLSFVAIMLCWLPWLIIFYPGSMWFDMCYQLEQYYFGNYSLHPVFATLCMGLCLDIGKSIFKSDNVGVFIYIFLQSVVCAFAFSKVIKLYQRLKTPRIVSVISLVYYCFLPIFGAYMQIGTKDVLSCGFFVLFTVQVVNICASIYCHETASLSFGEVISLFVISTLCLLYRKEMIILCVIILTSLLIVCLKKKMILLLKDIASVVAGMLIIYVFFNKVIVNLVIGGTFSAGSTEAFSIPLQQMARFVYYESDLISEDEKDILDQCFYYGYDGIAKNYNPYLSDPIKYNVGKSDRLEEVWCSLFTKKPMVYIEATIANSFGYYSIIPQLPATVNDAPTNGTPGSRFEFYINRDPDMNNKMVMVSYAPRFEIWRNKLSAYTNGLRSVPVVNLVYSLGFYTWGSVILIIYALKQHKRDTHISLVVFLPVVLSVGVCVASPVNDCLRYFLPVIANIPVIAGWIVSTELNTK